MRVKIVVDTSKCVADALVEAESIIIDKVDDGLSFSINPIERSGARWQRRTWLPKSL